MGLVVIIDFSLILLILYTLSKKRLHHLEQAFISLLILFSFTVFTSIFVDNVRWWEISGNIESVLGLKFFEFIIVPVSILFYLNIRLSLLTRLIRFLFDMVSVAYFMLMEYGLIQMKFLTHQNWRWPSSIILWGTLLLVSLFFQISFRKILQREGGEFR